MYLDVSLHHGIGGLVRVVERPVQSLDLKIEWLPLEELLRPTLAWQDMSWPCLVGTYGSLGELYSDASKFVGRDLTQETDVADLPNLAVSVSDEVLDELEKAVASRALCPPDWRRFRYVSSDWDAVDLVGDSGRSLEVADYRSLLAAVESGARAEPWFEEELAQASNRFPESGLMDIVRSRALLDAEQATIALRSATLATTREPDYAVAWVQLAIVHRSLGVDAASSLARARDLRHWDDSYALRLSAGIGE